MFALLLFQTGTTRLIRLNWVDTTIIAVYFIAVLAVGFYRKE